MSLLDFCGSMKRPSDTDDADLPIAKKMNRLHIGMGQTNESQLNENNTTSPLNGLSVPNNNASHHQSDLNNRHQQVNGQIQNGSLRSYSPELNANNNPRYYEVNKLLFEAHQQRLSRSSRNANTMSSNGE